MRKHIPNVLTLCNLICGLGAILLACKQHTHDAVWMILAASVFDFLDGFVARWLNIKSDMGKELDSLSDMISFGLAPAVIAYCHMAASGNTCWMIHDIYLLPAIISIGYPCFSALRLAKFNLDHRQGDMFYGLPTPAAAFVLISIQFFPQGNYTIILYAVVVLSLSLLMISNLPLIALKFKDFHLKTNIYRYILIIYTMVLVMYFHFQAIPFVILGYILLSVIQKIHKHFYQ
jgi:CDP-diacylglycerol--serine O-phosphatidyltransferase